MEVLVWVLLVVVIGGGLAVSWYLKQKRREEIGAFALSHGLDFSAHDPFGMLVLPFRLFRRGDGQGIENVLWGGWKGEAVTAFDFWYYTESTDGDGGRSRHYRRFSCAMLEVPAALPPLEIGPEGVLGRLADAVGIRDLEFESEAFNRRYSVRGVEKRFAYELIDARMIRWLLALRRDLSFEIAGTRLLVFSSKMRPRELPILLGAASSFRARIPRVVWSLYGAGSQAPGP